MSNLTRRKDLYQVDPTTIVVKEGFNVRSDYGDIEELKNSIVESGLRVPLRGYKDKEGKHIITDGHRRLKAILLAIKNGIDIPYVDFNLEPRDYNEEKRTLDLIICNDGKRLTPIEEAEVYQRLMNFGYKEAEIAKKIGRSITHIYDALKLLNTPKMVQEMVKDKMITASAVIQITKHTDNSKKQSELVEQAIEKAMETNAKIATAKHIDSKAKSDKKINQTPYNFLMELFDKTIELEIQNDKTELICELLVEMKAGKSIDELIELFK